jgi:hypothetical protein
LYLGSRYFIIEEERKKGKKKNVGGANEAGV